MYIGQYLIKNPLILAPMAGVSQMPFRRIALKHGAGLAPTELISAKGLFFGNLRTKTYLTYDSQVEYPFCVQLFGGEEEAMATGAEKAVAMGANIIDINMGCPVKKVTKTNAGSALLCDVKRAQKIILAMKKRVGDKVPITVKIRSGWDQEHLNYLEVGRAFEDVGIAAIALHARTRAQGYSGKADWEHIKQLKEHLSIPVIGNGDIKSKNHAEEMMAITGCDAVMIGRAALGNPWVFSTSSTAPSKEERFRTVKEHFLAHIELARSTYDEKLKEDLFVKSFRSHLIWYSKGLRNANGFRQEVMTLSGVNEVLEKIEGFFAQEEESLDMLMGENLDYDVDYRQAFG